MKIVILITALFFQALNGFCQEGQKEKAQEDSLIVSKVDFLIYQVETIDKIISLQSGSITNMNLIIQLFYEENRRMRNEIDSLYKVLETFDMVKIKRTSEKKRK